MPFIEDDAMIINQRPAIAGLRSVVRSFAERRAELSNEVVTTPLPARPDQFIEFYLQDRYRVSHDGGAPTTTPEMVIVGPQSYRKSRLFLSGSIHVFTIRFQPGGFHALFGVPMTTLVNEGLPAADVLGFASVALHDAVLSACDFPSRVAAAEAWIGKRLQVARGVDRVSYLAAALHRSGGRLAIHMLAQRAELSERQFTRRFETQVGLKPKLFARAVRLNAVFEAKLRSPQTTWTQLVHGGGYADQAHFVRDCRSLAGDAPSGFFAEWSASR
jgi:AraC-like DNA-binding protein